MVAFVVRFLPELGDLTLPVAVTSVAVGPVIGVTEEVLWRGTFVRVFPENRWVGYVYPAVGFAVWHVAPLAVYGSSAPGGTYSFVLYSLLFGLSMGYYAWQTGSIRWATAAHVAQDALGVPGVLWLGILTTVA